MLPQRSTRTDLFFLVARLLSASQHHNTEFHVASEMEQKPKTQMFVQWFVCPKNFEWINVPTIIIWWSWLGLWSWRLTHCTHLLSYLQPVKCCCGVCWGISIDMFWDVHWVIVSALDCMQIWFQSVSGANDIDSLHETWKFCCPFSWSAMQTGSGTLEFPIVCRLISLNELQDSQKDRCYWTLWLGGWNFSLRWNTCCATQLAQVPEWKLKWACYHVTMAKIANE